LWKNPDWNVANAKGDISIEKLKKGGYSVQLFAVFAYPDAAPDLATVGKAQVDAFHTRVLDRSSGEIVQAVTHSEVEYNRSKGVISAMLAMEGADVLNDDPTNLEWYARQGVRVLSVTWNNSNGFADGLREDNPPPRGGLVPLGRTLIQAMEKNRIVADLSHAHWETFWDIVTTIRGPVVATHSNARSVRNHRRNLDDEQLLAIAEKEGLVGLCYHSPFVDKKRRAELDDLWTHAAYIAELVGWDHLALGSDFDGNIRHPRRVRSASHVPRLLARFKDQGATAENVAALAMDNFLRMLKAADERYESIPPLNWRPLRAVPTRATKDDAPAYDRLASTYRLVCARRGKGLQRTFEFKAAGTTPRQVALRLSTASGPAEEVDVTMSLFAAPDSPPSQTEGSCRADGRRCLLELGTVADESARSMIAVTLETAASAEKTCLKVQDIVPIAVIAR